MVITATMTGSKSFTTENMGMMISVAESMVEEMWRVRKDETGDS